MAEHDPLDDLRDVLRTGEHAARPLPVERVRVLGRRRRTRRRVAAATLTLALVVAWRRPTPADAGSGEEPEVVTADLRAPAP